VNKFELGPFRFTYPQSERALYCDEAITIAEKQLVAIIGESGSGKSTLLALIKGLIPQHTAGRLIGGIYYDGKIATELPAASIAYLFQNPFCQLIHRQVKEEMVFSMENALLCEQEITARLQEFTALFDIERLITRDTHVLSTGECQRLLLASLLALKPKILLLDEPTAFLDEAARDAFYKMLAVLKEQMSIFIVDHHLEALDILADKVIHVAPTGAVSEVQSVHIVTTKSTVQVEPIEKGLSDFQLVVDQLNFSYEKNRPLLQNINLHANSREVISIMGCNGQGKSTLFKILAGLLKPWHGSINWYQQEVLLPIKNIAKHMGFVFQNPESDFYTQDVAAELQLVAGKKPVTWPAIMHLLAGVDKTISPFLLSEGQKRRLSIALQLLQNKSIIFYDEPTFGQDSYHQQLIVELLLELKAAHKLQLIITHDWQFARQVSDKIFILANGQLEQVT